MTDLTVRNNQEDSRFEVEVDGDQATLAYELEPGKITLIHTEVPAELEGRGIGSALARAGLDYARANGLKAVVLCNFVRSYLLRHSEYNDVLRSR